jgi:hypothetical protein
MLFIEHANEVRDTVMMVNEKVTDCHSSFTLGIKVPGVGAEGEFPFPGLETISILRYRLSQCLHRESQPGSSFRSSKGSGHILAQFYTSQRRSQPVRAIECCERH